MKVSIIGGSGFVGTSLSRQLKKSNINYSIYDLNFNPHDSLSNFCDVTDEGTLQNIEDESIIINLAAEHRDDVVPVSRYDDVNVEGAKNICSIASKRKINRIIFTSSVAVYGFPNSNTYEDGKIDYCNDYGRTKHLAEEVYKKWYFEDPNNRMLLIVRPTVIFGEGNRGNVFNLLNQIASRKFVMIGNGKNIKSMAYVENVSSFLRYGLTLNSGIHVYNYSDKPDLDMNTLVHITRKKLFKKNNTGLRLPAFIGIFIGYIFDILKYVSGINLPISSIRVKKFLKTTQFSSSINTTNFKPLFTLESGLDKTLKYEFLEDNSDKAIFKTE